MSDCIVVTGSKTWIPRIESTIWLKTLSINPSTVWIRSAHFKWAIILLVCVIAVSTLMLPGSGLAFIPILIVDGVLLLPALAYAVWSRTLIRYAHFRTVPGATVLSVGDAGPNRSQFESFVNELIQRIQAAQIQ